MTTTTSVAAPRRSGSHVVRKDIQALRAVAVSLVVIYHLWPNRLPGGFIGVDVFFVISGFLITGGLVARTPFDRRTLVMFWERRIRRLLPAGLLVLVTTLVASRLLAPETEWIRTAKQSIAAAFYVENWALARESVDYLSADTAPSAVQHFWSLSVEEQFYVFWPLLVGAVLWWAHRRRVTATRALRSVIGVIIIASFTFGVWATQDNAATAYFITPTRVWELAIGGFVAVHVAQRSGGRRRRGSGVGASALAWTGLAAIAITAFSITGATPFPGWIAAVPVVGAALVLLAAAHEGWHSPERIGALRPIQWLGDISYSVYLWHWPILVMLPYVSDHLGLLDRLAVLTASLVVSDLSKRFVEDRWRRPSPQTPARRVYVLGLVGMLMIAVIGTAQVREENHRLDQARQALEDVKKGGTCFGSQALRAPQGECRRIPDGPLVPSPALAAQDRSAVYSDRCMIDIPYGKVRTCTFGKGKTQVALAGNSHSSQWLPTLQVLAKKYDLTITTFIGSQCSTIEGLLDYPDLSNAKGCQTWARDMRTVTSGKKFDLVISSQRNVHPVAGYTIETSQQAWVDGFREFLDTWTASGTNLLIIKDTPFIGKDVPTCVAEHLEDQSACAGARAAWLPDDPLYTAARQLGPGRVRTADFSDALCEPKRCYAVNGGVITYFDGSHMTGTYAKTLAPLLDRVLAKALDRP